MLKIFAPSLTLVILGSLLVTFSMTKQMSEKVLLTLLIVGTTLNILGVVILYIRFQKMDFLERDKSQKKCVK
ncbi:MAG: hypothetical protein KBT36_07685 [Kurthia sp.]|nr:hypothetical protein [Candidatus Kurthia equi]